MCSYAHMPTFFNYPSWNFSNQFNFKRLILMHEIQVHQKTLFVVTI